MTENSIINIGTNRATARGTEIVKSNSDMGKDAFLKILVAELSNQDPTEKVDSTQYVTQLAQFTSLEQMTNLNSTMSYSSYSSLIGKAVTLSDRDASGVPYTGIVDSVTKDGAYTYLSVLVNENGTNVYKDFDASHIVSVINVPNYNLDNITGNLSILTASSLIGKNADFTVNTGEEAEKYSGIVQGVFTSQGSIKFNVKLNDTGEIITLNLSQLTGVKEA